MEILQKRFPAVSFCPTSLQLLMKRQVKCLPSNQRQTLAFCQPTGAAAERSDSCDLINAFKGSVRTLMSVFVLLRLLTGWFACQIYTPGCIFKNTAALLPLEVLISIGPSEPWYLWFMGCGCGWDSGNEWKDVWGRASILSPRSPLDHSARSLKIMVQPSAQPVTCSSLSNGVPHRAPLLQCEFSLTYGPAFFFFCTTLVNDWSVYVCAHAEFK